MIQTTELNPTTSDLEDFKTHLTLGHSTPKEFLHRHSEMMDGLVRKAFQRAQVQTPTPSVCLIAVGGYGRRELSPFSDVDLLLLHASSQKEALPPLTEKILYPLWDLGIDVSCSSRSINESLKMAQSDVQVKTGLIDGRFLDGEYEFFRKLHDLFARKVLYQKVRNFAEALAKERSLRHQKYEDPAYALEPNIKEGEGGLRDFQIGRWLIRAKYKTDRWESILFPDHSRMLDKSVEFLWGIRNQLHLLSGRRQDDFTFEFQEKIAPMFGFPPGPAGIEGMMRQYHLSAQRIANFAQDVLERILHEPSLLKKTFSFLHRRKIDEHFGMAYGELHLLDPVLFKADPFQLMTLFKICQRHKVKMDFRTEEAVVEALPFIDERFRESEKVNRTFLSILKQGDAIDVLLKKMHELGLLSRYIPEFSEIEGKVHYDLYHVHPVDRHSILSVEVLRKLKEGVYQKDYPHLTSLMREIEKPEILFLTALLHDIGKGGEGDHSQRGAEISRRIGDRMGLSNEEKEGLEFLVWNHLLMVETALRRDLQDEQVIFRFANEIKNLDQLKRLYLLTFADIQAVGPEAWTEWKHTLLMELFLKTAHLLERESLSGPFFKGEERMRKLMESLPPEVLSDYVDVLPERYLSCYPVEEIAHHIEMARSIQKEFCLVEWERKGEIRAKVTLCTKDRYGLFSKITGSMFLNRLNILEAQVHTWGNGIALDTFWVEDATQELEKRLRQFEKDLKEILNGKVSLKDLLSMRNEKAGIKTKVVPKVAEKVKINNRDSDFYTIIEVTGEDQLGILYELTEALTDSGCNISFARISTLGNQIVDVFYVQDEWGEKMRDRQKLDHLKQTLLKRLSSKGGILS